MNVDRKTKIVFISLMFCGIFGLVQNSQATTVDVDASISQGVLSRQYLNFGQGRQGNFDRFTTAEQQRVRDIGAKFIRIDGGTHLVSTAEGAYNWSIIDGNIENIKAAGAEPVIIMGYMPEWLADKSYGPDPTRTDYPYIGNPPANYVKWQTVVQDFVHHLNNVKKYNIKYFFVWNEPDCCSSRFKNMADYNLLYSHTARGVKVADPTAKVGGPVLSALSTQWINSLASYAQANSLPLDVVDWHTYTIATSPAIVKSQAATVRSILASKGFASAAVWITEWAGGDYANKDLETTKLDVDRAAGAVAPVSFYLLNENIEGFYFRLRRSTPIVQGVFADATGNPFPNANVFKMLGMLANTRVQSTNAMNSSGIGVGSIAAKDAAQATALIWNYQNRGTANAPITVNFANLPPSFAGKNIRLQRYLVDSETSNIMHDPAKAELQMVEEKVLVPTSAPNHTFTLIANAVSLVIISPVGGVDVIAPVAPSGLRVQ